jgi:hypothetical protein
MQKFFLTYQIEQSGEYIVPERLPAARPDYAWDELDNLLLRYKYDLFMPKGIMSQFTVQMHRYIADHDLVWTRGVLLERADARAEIVESYDARTIKIRISGPNRLNRRDFMTIITEALDGINAQYEKMAVDKLIPCNCQECQAVEVPYFFEHKDLKRRLEKGRQEVECGKISDEVLTAHAEENASAPSGRPPEPIVRDKVFISHSRKDSEWLARVQTHLEVLENLGIPVQVWDDTQIKAGMRRREEIEKALAGAKVAILLVSTDFLRSDFISEDELPPLLKAAHQDGATILPLILKPSLFDQHKELYEFQAVNDPEEPLSTLEESEQDKVMVALARRVVELMAGSE